MFLEYSEKTVVIFIKPVLDFNLTCHSRAFLFYKSLLLRVGFTKMLFSTRAVGRIMRVVWVDYYKLVPMVPCRG